MRRIILKSAFSVALLLLLATPALAQTPVPSGTVTGEMRLGDQVIPLTHVYVMEPFVLPDAPPDPEVARRLIVILADRPYPGDISPTSIDPFKAGRDDSYSGLHLEFDRGDGRLLFAQTSRAAGTASIPVSLSGIAITVERFELVGGTAIVSVNTGPLKHANPVVPGSKIVIVRGTALEYPGSDPRGASARKYGFDFSATFASPIQPAPRLLKTLFGYQARTSDIAQSYAAILEQERQNRIAEIKQQLVEFDLLAADMNLDQVARDKARQEMFARLPDAKDLSDRMARLEKIYVYQTNAVLRFRPETFRHDKYRAPKIAMLVGQQSEGEIGNQKPSNMTLLRDPLATITILSTEKSSIDMAHYRTRSAYGGLANIAVVRQRASGEVKQPWLLYGESILPFMPQVDLNMVHMILDDGEWRLARN